MRIVEIILGLGMITCAIYLGISTYKTHFRKKSADDNARALSEATDDDRAALDTTEQSDHASHSGNNA